jgi:hypothetical protein
MLNRLRLRFALMQSRLNWYRIVAIGPNHKNEQALVFVKGDCETEREAESAKKKLLDFWGEDLREVPCWWNSRCKFEIWTVQTYNDAKKDYAEFEPC